LRKRNASDGDSGFDSALSSRSSSICLEENTELNDFKISKIEEHPSPPSQGVDDLNSKFQHILDTNEVIFKDDSVEGLFIIRDSNTGRETQYKPPGRIRFDSSSPRVEETYSAAEYDRAVSVSRSHLFNSRLQLELEKQVAQMELLEIDLLLDRTQVPPPSLGIRIIGVNMIHGVPDKLNIYVKKVMPDSVSGRDARIRVDDHIVEVNGVSLVGVSQKLAADTLSSCMVNPENSSVHFVLARAPEAVATADSSTTEDVCSTSTGQPDKLKTSVSEGDETRRDVSSLPSVPNVDGLMDDAKADPSVISTSVTACETPVTSCGIPVSSDVVNNVIVSPAGPLHSGTSEAFIPCSTPTSISDTTPNSAAEPPSSTSCQPAAGSLSESLDGNATGLITTCDPPYTAAAANQLVNHNLWSLPAPVLKQVASYLDNTTKASLASYLADYGLRQLETDKAADIVTNKSFLPPCSSSADGDNCSNQQFAGSKAVSLPAAAAKVVDPDSNNNNNDSLQQTTALKKNTTASAKVPLKKDATSTNADVNVVSDHRRIILNAIQQPVVPCI